MQETIQNLAKAFVGESQARNRYTFYAKIARTEGYEQIGGVFELTANQEKEHANWLMKLINELKKKYNLSSDAIKVEIEVSNLVSTTLENLKAAIAGENFEHTKMYPEFADMAEKEGLKEIADRLRSIAVAEAHHEERYQKLLDNLEAGTLFKKAEQVYWVCRECGYVHWGTEAPKNCPSCGHAQGFYELKNETY